MEALDTTSIIEQTNERLLKGGYEIESDDPVLANVILNQVILSRYVDEINQTLETHHKRMLKALETEEESARQIASKVITQSADYLADKIKSTKDVVNTSRSEITQQSPFINWKNYLLFFSLGLFVGIFLHTTLM